MDSAKQFVDVVLFDMVIMLSDTVLGNLYIFFFYSCQNRRVFCERLAGTLCVFLKVTGRENRTLFPPLIIMLCVTFTALVERVIALVKAYGAGTAVFLVEGLQLIIAILLMVLGVIIVISCGKELFRKKAGQETK